MAYEQLRWTLDQVKPSRGWEEATLEALLTEKSETAGQRGDPRRYAAVAVVAAMALAICTVAAALGLPVLFAHFGGGAGYAQSSMFVGRSVTSDGWTMTLTDCVGDDRRLYLGFTVEAPEGTVLDTVLDEEYTPLKDIVEFSSGKRYSASYWTELADGDPADNKMSLALWLEYIQRAPGEPGLLGETMTLRLEGFGAYVVQLDSGKVNEVRLCDGVWDFGELDLSFIDRTIRMEPNVPVTMSGLPAVVTYLEVSPTGVNVWLEGEGLRGHEAFFPWGSCVNTPEIVVYDKAGNAIDQGEPPFGKRGGSGCASDPEPPELPCINVVQTYENLLDMENLDHIDVCGVTIPLGE